MSRLSTLSRLAVAVIVAAGGAVLPGALRMAAQSYPAPAPATVSCTTDQIQVWLWDSYNNLWGTRCVGAGQTLLSSEGDIVSFPSSLSSTATRSDGQTFLIADPADNTGLLDISASVPAGSGGSINGQLKTSTSCGADGVGCDKGPSATVCVAIDATCNADSTQVRKVDVQAPDTGGSVGVYTLTATTANGPIQFSWDVSRWAKGDVFAGLFGGVMKVYDRDFNFKRYVALSDYERFGVVNGDGSTTLPGPNSTDLSGSGNRTVNAEPDYTFPVDTYDAGSKARIGQLVAGCGTNPVTGNVYVTNFDSLDPGLNVITRQAGNLSDAAHGDLPYADLSRRIPTTVLRSDDLNGTAIDTVPESVKFDAQQNLYVGHSGVYSPSGGGSVSVDPTFNWDGNLVANTSPVRVDNLGTTTRLWDSGGTFYTSDGVTPLSGVDSSGNAWTKFTIGFKSGRIYTDGQPYWENRARVWANVQGGASGSSAFSWLFLQPADALLGVPNIPFRRVLGANLHIYDYDAATKSWKAPRIRSPFVSGSGLDWIDLTSPAGGSTVLYTSEYGDIHRYDRASGQLSNLNSELLFPGRFHALRLLPPGDGTDMIVAGASPDDPTLSNVLYRVQIIGGKATVVQQYVVLDAQGQPMNPQPPWYAIDISPDGRTMWAAPFLTGDLYQFDVRTGFYATRKMATFEGATAFDGQGVCIMWQYNTQQELCGNGVDDDGNGLVDENCAPIPSQPQTKPVASPDPYVTRERAVAGDPGLTVSAPGILVNDGYGGDYSLLAVDVASVTQPASGVGSAVAVNANGSFTYTPKLAFHGQDTFTYRVRLKGTTVSCSDTSSPCSEPVTVTITVTPLVSDDGLDGSGQPVYNVLHGRPLAVAATGVLANDSNAPMSVTAVGPTSLVGTAVGSGGVASATEKNGTVFIRPDGSFDYQSPVGYVGLDHFYYRANDGINDATNADTATYGGSARYAKVTLNVTNTPPVAVNNTYSTQVNSPIDYRYAPCAGVEAVRDYGCVPDEATNLSNGIRDKVEGSADSDPDADAIVVREWALPSDALPPVAIRDGGETWVPTATMGTTTMAACGGLSSGYTDVYCHTTSGGRLEVWPDGKFRYYPAAGWSGQDTFYYRVSDGAEASNWATVIITVNALPPPPVAYNNHYETITGSHLDVHYGASPDVPYTGCLATAGFIEGQNPITKALDAAYRRAGVNCPPPEPNPNASKGILKLDENSLVYVDSVQSVNVVTPTGTFSGGIPVLATKPGGTVGPIDSGATESLTAGLRVYAWGELAADMPGYAFSTTVWDAPASSGAPYVCKGMAVGTTDAYCDTMLGGVLEVWPDGTFRYYPPDLGEPKEDWFYYRVVDEYGQLSNWAQATINVKAKMEIRANPRTRPYGAAGPDTNGVNYFDFLLNGAYTSVAQPISRPADMIGTSTCTAWQSAGQPVTPFTPVGVYPITCEGETRTGYQITYVASTLTITPVPLTVTADDKTKIYDGQPFPTASFTVAHNGFVNGEGPGVLGGTLTFGGPAVTAVNANTSPGYQIVPSGLTSSNYSPINFVPGVLTITPLTPTVSVPSVTVPYDGQPHSTTCVVSSPDAAELTGTLSYSAEGRTDVGTYTATCTFAGDVNHLPASGSGTVTVTPVPLTITADDKQKVYDGQPFPYEQFTVQYAGFVNGEDPSVLTGTLAYSGAATTAIDANANPGYEIKPGGLSSSNYSPITYVSGALRILPLTPTVTVPDVTEPYNGLSHPTTCTVTSPDGAALTGTLSYSPAGITGVGAYTATCNFAGDTNHLPASGSGTITITPIPLTVIADDKSKVYDKLPYAPFTAHYSGFVNGEGPSVLTGTLAFSGTSQGAVNVGSYGITPSGLSSTNYSPISYVSATLTITPAPLTITANNQGKLYGTEFVFVGTEFAAAGLKGSDTVGTATLASAGAPASALPGNYDIFPSAAVFSVGLAGNYTITYVPGILNVFTNRPPIAEDDFGTTTGTTPISISVLPNDHDPDAGDTISVVPGSVTQPIALINGAPVVTGTVVMDYATGVATYTAPYLFAGVVKFDYTIRDQVGASDTDPTNPENSIGTVTITVLPAEVCYVGTKTPQVTARQQFWADVDGTITIRTWLGRRFNDNTYGAGAIGWPGGNHTFRHLVTSDMVQIALFDRLGAKSMEFKQDYVSAVAPTAAAPSGYRSLSVTGGDGAMIVGSAADVVGANSSLAVNLNNGGVIGGAFNPAYASLTVDSPATDATYTPNPIYPNWIFDVWYEVTIKASALGAAGFGYPRITAMHASPSKTGVETEPLAVVSCTGPDEPPADGSIDAPIGAADAYEVKVGKTLSVGGTGVLGNDVDPLGQALTAALDSNVNDGTLTFKSNGTFSYRPSPKFTGVVTFTYRPRNAAGIVGGPVTVTVTVKK